MTEEEHQRAVDAMNEHFPEQLNIYNMAHLIATLVHGYKIPPERWYEISAEVYEILLAQPEHTGLEPRK